MDMLILKKDDNYIEMIDKLREEVDELRRELELHVYQNENNKEEIAAETLDVIQVCIGILDKLERLGVDIKRALERHNKKLLERGWEYEKVIHIDIEGGQVARERTR